MATNENFDLDLQDEDAEDFVVNFGEVTNASGGTSNFNDLSNRPKYDGQLMTGDTNIPKTPTKTSDLTNDSDYQTGSEVDSAIDSAIGELNIPTKTSDLENDGEDGSSVYIEADELASVATSGSYNDLNNKPTIPAAQVNSDWNADSGVAQILNKPTIPTVNDATLTITQNGTSKGTFTANDADDTTIEVSDTTYTAGTGIDITNGVISATGGGSVKTLTTDDYNYPTANPDGVALWTLDEGQYIISQRTYYYTNSGGRTSTSNDIAVMVFKKAANNARGVFAVIGGATGNSNIYYSIDENGNSGSEYPFTANPINHLTSDNTKLPLAANQGRVLKELIDSLVITGAGAPTASTTGTVGQLYEDTTNGKLYQCTAVSGGTYTWEEVGAGGGGGGDTVYSTKTTSNSSDGGAVYIGPLNANQEELPDPTTTDYHYKYFWALPYDVSGQDNFGIPKSETINIGGQQRAGSTGDISIGYRSIVQSGNSTAIGYQAWSRGEGYNIAIGPSSAISGGSCGIAIGRQAETSSNGSIALGAFSRTSRVGEVYVGTTRTGYGFNNTNYRVIGGVHDGQDAHDCLTVGQANSLIDAINTALSTNIPHVGA